VVGRLLAEPEVKAFAEGFEQSLRQAFGVGARAPLAIMGLAPEDFDGIVLNRAGFALVGATFERGPAVDAVLLLEARAGGEKLGRIAQGLRAGAEAFLGAKFAEADVRGRKVHATSVPGHEICVSVAGCRLIVTTRGARMEEVLKALDEGHPQALAAAPRFARLKERMGAARSAIFAYADAPALARIALDAFAYLSPEGVAHARRIGTGLGLDAVEALGFADVPEGGEYRTEAAVLLKERRGVFALLPDAAPSHRFARLAPMNALLYAGETFDAHAFWEGVVALAGTVDPAAAAHLEGAEAKANAFLGLDLRADLLRALGTEWGGYVAWRPEGGLFPDLVLCATVRDRDRLGRALDTLAAKAGEVARKSGASVTPGRTDFRGTEIRFLEVTDRRGDPRPYAPAWAFGADFVVFGLCPQAVKHALEEKPALSARAEFQRVLARAPRGTVSATYVDLGRVATWLYATAVPALQAAQGALNRQLAALGVRVNFEDLPPAGVLARHLGGLVAYTVVEPDAVRVGFVSPFGAPLVVAPVGFVAGAVAVLVPRGQAVGRARAQAELAEAEMRRAEAEARRAEAAARAAAERAELDRLRAENELLRKRLGEIERQVEELRRSLEEKAK
jgi:hypothetical protein